MANVYFTPQHLWIALEEEGLATLGITQHAQEQLGDVVFVELPSPGKKIPPGELLAAIESVKTASDVFSPAALEVTEVNVRLQEDPALINRAAESEGWLVKVQSGTWNVSSEWMDAQAYARYLADLD